MISYAVSVERNGLYMAVALCTEVSHAMAASSALLRYMQLNEIYGKVQIEIQEDV